MAARPELPAGMVTFVFTDIEGSTRLFRRIGDRYPALLERHNELVRIALAAHRGVEVKTEGDAFFVAFAEAVDAVEACAHAQRNLAAEPWPADAEVRVRFGLHTGLASPRGADYVAFAVHQAARVVSAGHGGQILVSSDTAGRALALASVTAAAVLSSDPGPRDELRTTRSAGRAHLAPDAAAHRHHRSRAVLSTRRDRRTGHSDPRGDRPALRTTRRFAAGDRARRGPSRRDDGG